VVAVAGVPVAGVAVAVAAVVVAVVDLAVVLDLLHLNLKVPAVVIAVPATAVADEEVDGFEGAKTLGDSMIVVAVVL